MVLGLQRFRTKLLRVLPSPVRQSLVERKLETLKEELPSLVHQSLETLLERQKGLLELATAYDILWRYLREQNNFWPNNLRIEESDIFEQSLPSKNLVDFLFDHFNLDYRMYARLNEATIQSYSKAEKHYEAALEADPSAVLPRKRLALMRLTQNFIHYALLVWEEFYDCTGDPFAKNRFEQLSKYHEKYNLMASRSHFINLAKMMREHSDIYTADNLQMIDHIIKEYEGSQKEEEDDIVKRQRHLASTQRNPVLKAAGLTFAGVEEYVRENPDDEDGYLELHRQHVLRSQLHLAFEVLKDAVKEHPDFLEARKVLAMDRYAWKGEWLKTIQELEELREDLPDDPGVVLPLIHLYEELRMTGKTDELWESFFRSLIFGDAANSCDISKITGSRNSVHHIGNFEFEVFGLPFNVIIKFFPDLSEEGCTDDKVVEYEVIKSFREIAEKRPELGLLHSLPVVRYYSPKSPFPRPGVCLVTKGVSTGWTLERGGGDFFKENILPRTLKLLAAIHAASLEFPEGKLMDVVANAEGFFEGRLESTFFKFYGSFAPLEESVVESFRSYYSPISSVLESLPRCYYKDANLKNWMSPIGDEKITAIDFEKNWLLPPQLDLVSLLEFGREYLDDEDIDEMLQIYHSSFCGFSGEETSLSDFMEAYPYAAVQRHLELIGYRKRDSASSQDEEELQKLENEIDYHANRTLHYLSYLADKHSGDERDDILELERLLPQLLPSLTGAQP